MNSATAAVHSLALGLWAGISAFFLLVVGPGIFEYFSDWLVHPPPGVSVPPKEIATRMAGDLVSRIFPAYFGLQSICALIAAATAWRLARVYGRKHSARAILLSVACAGVLLNAVWLYPKTAETRAQQNRFYDVGDIEGYTATRQRFLRIHGFGLALDATTALIAAVALGLLGPAQSPPSRQQ